MWGLVLTSGLAVVVRVDTMTWQEPQALAQCRFIQGLISQCPYLAQVAHSASLLWSFLQPSVKEQWAEGVWWILAQERMVLSDPRKRNDAATIERIFSLVLWWQRDSEIRMPEVTKIKKE